MLPKVPGAKSAAATASPHAPVASAPAPAHAVLTPSPTHIPTSSLPPLVKKPAHEDAEPKSNTALFAGLGVAALIVVLLIVYFFVIK